MAAEMDTTMKVIIALDHTECSHAAFNCKFVYRIILFIVYKIILLTQMACYVKLLYVQMIVGSFVERYSHC